MAAYSGFGTATPTERYGSAYGEATENLSVGNRFAVPGDTGTVEITEIGAYLFGITSAARAHFAIFKHDGTNDNPDTMVVNSDTGELTPSTADYTKCNYVYTGTKPVLNAGGTYWLCLQAGGDTVRISRVDTGGVGCFNSGTTYPDWLSAAQWDSAADTTRDNSFYAVYQVPATAAFARPSSDVAGGTFRSILVTAPFGPRVIA